MANKIDKSKIKLPTESDGDSQGELSLEKLDSLIEESDPEFVKNLNRMASDIREVKVKDLEDSPGEQTPAEIEGKRWRDHGGIVKLLAILVPFLPWFYLKLKTFVEFIILLLKRARNFVFELKYILPVLILNARDGFRRYRISFTTQIKNMRYYSAKKKLALVALLGCTVGSGFLFHRMATRGLLPEQFNIFLGSMSDWAEETYQIDEGTKMEAFYDSTRSSQNIILLKKMIVNIRPSTNSGSNPMGAFEFFVEGISSEVVVEVKDREAEVSDIFQRTIEEMSYDQLSTGAGKKQLCDRLRQQVNKHLSSGLVRRVLLKTAIIKP